MLTVQLNELRFIQYPIFGRIRHTQRASLLFFMSIKHALKHHFIPQKGNNYHPHVLHLKRAIFYGSFLTAIKAFAVVFAVLLPTEAFLAPDVLAAQGQKIIELTNSVRREQGLTELDKNAVLVRSATMKAEDMDTQQYFSHASPDGHRLSYFLKKAGYNYSTAGENLAVGFSNADEVVAAWMKSPTHYSNLIDTDFEQLGVGLVAGSFEGEPTVFVAQHFGTPEEPVVVEAPVPQPVVQAIEPKVEPTVPKPTPKPKVTASVPIVPIVEKEPVVEPKVISTPTTTKPEVQEPVRQPEAIQVVSDIQVIEHASTSTGEFAIQGSTSGTEEVLGTTVSSDAQMDANGSFVAWADAGKDSTTLTAQVMIEGDVVQSKVTIAGYVIPLQKGEDGFYRGLLTIPVSSDSLFHVIVSPTIDISWPDGTNLQTSIAWKHPKVIGQSPWERYLQANSWLYSSIPVFPVVHAIYWFALIFFSVALILSIVIEVRKQHPHVIAQTLCLIGLIAVYLKF
jgi:uncharacterized protein YkwD